MLLVVAMASQGCGGLRFLAPDNPIEESGILDVFRDKMADNGLVELVNRYYASVDDGEKQSLRNELVAGLTLLIDNEYEYFASRMLGVRAFVNTGLDTASGGLAIASTLVSHVETGKLLAGIGAGLLGLRLSVDKEFFYEQSSPILVAQMEHDRAAAFAKLKEGLSKLPASYPMAVAIRDVGLYYQSGTLVHAFAELSKRVNSGSASPGLNASPRLNVKSIASDEIEVRFENPAIAGRNLNVDVVGYEDEEGKVFKFRKTLVGLAGSDGVVTLKFKLPAGAAGSAAAGGTVKRIEVSAPTSTPLVFFPDPA